MRFAIRDDDVGFETGVDSLEDVYGPLLGEGVPISFALVPFKSGKDGRETPLGENKALVNWIRARIDQGLASALLHGCTHRDGPDGPEFGAGSGHDGLIARGRAHLEELFGPVRIFVPPHNALSRPGLEAVKRAGLDLLGGFSFSPGFRGVAGVPWSQLLKRSLFQLKHRTHFYPYPVRAGGAWELACCPLTPSMPPTEIRRLLSLSVSEGGDFCLATHAWELKEPLRAELGSIVDEARGLGASFVRAEALFGD